MITSLLCNYLGKFDDTIEITSNTFIKIHCLTAFLTCSLKPNGVMN